MYIISELQRRYTYIGLLYGRDLFNYWGTISNEMKGLIKIKHMIYMWINKYKNTMTSAASWPEDVYVWWGWCL